MLPFRLLVLLTLLATPFFGPSTYAEQTQGLTFSSLPEAPLSLEGSFKGRLGDTVILAGGLAKNGASNTKVFALFKDAEEWREIGTLEHPWHNGASVVDGNKLLLIGGETNGKATAKTMSLSLAGQDGIKTKRLPDLPTALTNPAATVKGGTLYVAGGTTDGTHQGSTNSFISLELSDPNAAWVERTSWTSPARHSAFLINSVDTISLIGGIGSDGSPTTDSPVFHPVKGWRTNDSTSPQGRILDAAKLGDSHAIALINDGTQTALNLYHMIGDTWISSTEAQPPLSNRSQLISSGESFLIIDENAALEVELPAPDTNYGWYDHTSVALYFIALVYIGFYFTKKGKSSEEYFRGGHRIPWWATGMSLFATGASALSLMAMPAKSYAGNWAFFAISLYFLIALPIAMYLLAPLIRKLNYGTAFEYLEDRFGLSVRMLGSTIFALGQILGRMGTILLFPAAALDAIAGIPMELSVPVMGIVTIAYTYMGGLSAVIWTDTIQGFVMIASVLGCLILAWTKIDMPTTEIWTTLQDQSKLHVFDWGASLSTENVTTVFIGVIALTLLYIGDQNFVQRVQCTRNLREAKKAIATQLGVAIPINFLLFALGTALFIFYKAQPAELSPTIKTDGIFPFFAAQQLPPGVSGFVIAALLAATMSTISSSLCSVSNLIVDDYYKRFSKKATDAKAVRVGRWAILLIGVFGVSSAFYLNSFETPSLWDLFLRVASIISATTIGIYTLGLLTQKANEIGVLAGIAAGMIATYFVAQDEAIIFWLYPVYGSLVTMAVGYAVSLATGGNRKDIEGLTLATLKNRKGGLDD
ncbi:sodium:solute symporter [Pelagicoccus mobilis]|uniref:Sodium/solute symporter n=1 Tax=Pelagicoccus mobilis TaxID=415221 RepID=A0A934RQ61_9BACT|nr:sodium/solute symporter [Pelagicoccus mobilis]MBK1875470.1 sodium/solute symporter [Pelagicoccus mobilis]